MGKKKAAHHAAKKQAGPKHAGAGPLKKKFAKTVTHSAKRAAAKHKASRAKGGKKARWSQNIDTESTFPPAGLFTMDGKTVARIMSSRKVSPKGVGSAIRMIAMFINRTGKNLDSAQRRELEEAKRLLQGMEKRQKGVT